MMKSMIIACIANQDTGQVKEGVREGGYIAGEEGLGLPQQHKDTGSRRTGHVMKHLCGDFQGCFEFDFGVDGHDNRGVVDCLRSRY